MMAISRLHGTQGYRLDPAADCPASRGGNHQAPLTTTMLFRQLADRCDVLTYEFENVDAEFWLTPLVSHD